MNAVTDLKPRDLDNQIESTWDANTAAEVAEYGELVIDVEKQRKALNDKLSAGKSNLVSKGFNKDAIQAAVAYSKTAESERANFDLSYIYTRRALGCPVQSDLFEQASLDQVTVAHVSKDPKTI